MIATRRTQPYRKGMNTRRAGPVLAAMLRGKTAYGVNPQDVRRRTAKTAAGGLSRAIRNARRVK